MSVSWSSERRLRACDVVALRSEQTIDTFVIFVGSEVLPPPAKAVVVKVDKIKVVATIQVFVCAPSGSVCRTKWCLGSRST